MKKDNRLTVIEAKHNVKLIPSEIDKDLFYVFDDERKGMGFLILLDEEAYQFIGLTKQQARAVRDELTDMCEMIFD